MASTEIRRTTGSTPTNAEKFTVSLWFKLSQVGSSVGLFGWRENSNSGNNNLFIRINGNGNFQIYFTSNNGNDNHLTLLTNRLFRDCNSWYHAVISVDSSQSTSSDRAKLYINGIQETSFSSASYPASGRTFFSNDTQINFGKTRSTGDADTYFSGIQSHIHFTDGYAYDATPFGETDSTTGEWKIKTSVTGVNYGTNGFWWLKDSIATTDHSPNSNTFTVASGTLTKTEDSPSNVFATWNPLYRTSATSFAYGNTESQSPSTGGFAGISTLGASSGKYYAEFKLQAASTSYEACIAVMVGSSISGNDLPSGYPEYTVGSYGIRQGDASSGNAFWTTGAGGRTSGSHHGGFSIGDTIGIALDIDNNRVYFSKGGQWNNSGSWNSATPSTYLTLISTYGDGQYLFVSGDSSGGNTAKWSANFGNGYQQSTAVSSAGTNASGNGIFEYDVPTGYTALSTKGLNL